MDHGLDLHPLYGVFNLSCCLPCARQARGMLTFCWSSACLQRWQQMGRCHGPIIVSRLIQLLEQSEVNLRDSHSMPRAHHCPSKSQHVGTGDRCKWSPSLFPGPGSPLAGFKVKPWDVCSSPYMASRCWVCIVVFFILCILRVLTIWSPAGADFPYFFIG